MCVFTCDTTWGRWTTGVYTRELLCLFEKTQQRDQISCCVRTSAAPSASWPYRANHAFKFHSKSAVLTLTVLTARCRDWARGRLPACQAHGHAVAWPCRNGGRGWILVDPDGRAVRAQGRARQASTRLESRLDRPVCRLPSFSLPCRPKHGSPGQQDRLLTEPSDLPH